LQTRIDSLRLPDYEWKEYMLNSLDGLIARTYAEEITESDLMTKILIWLLGAGKGRLVYLTIEKAILREKIDSISLNNIKVDFSEKGVADISDGYEQLI